jgi:TIR domain
LPGADWATAIDRNLELADIILFLVSANFIDSRYCYGVEMARAIEREQAKMARAIPVIIRFCNWQPTPLGRLQVLPPGGRPVAAWGNQPSAQRNFELLDPSNPKEFIEQKSDFSHFSR